MAVVMTMTKTMAMVVTTTMISAMRPARQEADEARADWKYGHAGRGSKAFAVRALGRVPVLFISPKIHKALEQYLR